LLYQNEINTIYKVNNGYDFMFEGIFRDMRHMENFMDLIESKFKVLDQKSVYILEDLKREAFLCDHE